MRHPPQTRRARLWQALGAVVLPALTLCALAQVPSATPKPQPKAAVAPKPAAKTGAKVPATPPAAASAVAAAPAVSLGPSGPGYRTAAMPAWVKDPPATQATTRRSADQSSRARRDLLVDLQIQLAPTGVQQFFRVRSVGLDSSTLRDVSQPQVSFNPAFQTVVLHHASVTRDGQQMDRLKDARVELLRREQQLERQVIDGVQTALIVLNDVRVGDVVETAYTVEGENPIFERHFSALVQLAGDSPVDVLHLRIQAPPQRALHARGVSSDLVPERLVEDGLQVLRVLRTDVAAVSQEAATPPWFKIYPALHVSDFASWAEVNQWAQRLFALPPDPAPDTTPELAAFAGALQARKLPPEQLVAEALRFVQDEVRYFSISLGESSHRPKPPAKTFAERLGDCKDKVTLFNALLGQLGISAKPALVSMQRNRGVQFYLPSHDQFDHVISRVEIGTSVYFVDPTLNGQALTLQRRGYYPYGKALVVGGPDELVDVAPPAFAVDRIEYEQLWDLSDPRRDTTLTTLLRAHGAAAERWRGAVAGAGTQRIGESLAGGFTRLMPSIKLLGEMQVSDDRDTNVLEIRLSFSHPAMGQYSRGGLDLELNAFELLDALTVPPEARRRTPFLIDTTRVIDHRIVVQAPRPLAFRPPAPQQVGDAHFSLDWRVEVNASTGIIASRYERRADEVLPAQLETFRERIGRARALTGSRLRVSLVDFAAMRPDFERIDRRLRGASGFKADQLYEILLRNEANRVLDTAVLERIGPQSGHTARVLAERAMANNLLGDFDSSLKDSQSALALHAASPEALEARAVALVGLGRDREALEVLNSGPLANRSFTKNWAGAAHYLLGEYAQAEALLREVAQSSGGDEREFAQLWLYLAAERQGGRGREVIAPFVAAADTSKLTGALLHFFDGQLDRDGVLKVARSRQEMERLNLAEAYYFIGEQLQAQGKRSEALPWYERVVSTGAVPYREFTFAKRALSAAAGR